MRQDDLSPLARRVLDRIDRFERQRARRRVLAGALGGALALGLVLAWVLHTAVPEPAGTASGELTARNKSTTDSTPGANERPPLAAFAENAFPRTEELLATFSDTELAAALPELLAAIQMIEGGSPSALPPLVAGLLGSHPEADLAALRDSLDSITSDALFACSRVGGLSRWADAVRAALRLDLGRYARTVRAAAGAAELIGLPETVDAALALLESTDHTDRNMGLIVAQRRPDTRLSPALRTILQGHPFEEEGLMAAAALARIGLPEGLEHLKATWREYHVRDTDVAADAMRNLLDLSGVLDTGLDPAELSEQMSAALAAETARVAHGCRMLHLIARAGVASDSSLGYCRLVLGDDIPGHTRKIQASCILFASGTEEDAARGHARLEQFLWQPENEQANREALYALGRLGDPGDQELFRRVCERHPFEGIREDARKLLATWVSRPSGKPPIR